MDWLYIEYIWWCVKGLFLILIGNSDFLFVGGDINFVDVGFGYVEGVVVIGYYYGNLLGCREGLDWFGVYVGIGVVYC